MNALSPAKVQRVTIVDDQDKVMEVVVEDKQLSLAIGKKGQNVRLAAKLTGWRIDIKSEEEKRKEVEAQFGASKPPRPKSLRPTSLRPRSVSVRGAWSTPMSRLPMSPPPTLPAPGSRPTQAAARPASRNRIRTPDIGCCPRGHPSW